VGFYSAFLVADRVRVVTKSVEEDKVWGWEAASGSGEFKINEEAGSGLKRGTRWAGQVGLAGVLHGWWHAGQTRPHSFTHQLCPAGQLISHVLAGRGGGHCAAGVAVPQTDNRPASSFPAA